MGSHPCTQESAEAPREGDRVALDDEIHLAGLLAADEVADDAPDEGDALSVLSRMDDVRHHRADTRRAGQERPTVGDPGRRYHRYTVATTSISTAPPAGSAATWKVERAG